MNHRPSRVRASAIVALLATSLVLIGASPAAAVLPPVVNAGFELPVLGNGAESPTTPSWTQSLLPGATASPAPVGTFNPVAGTHVTTVPEGENVAFSNGYMLSQALVGVADAGYTYTLSVASGRRLDVGTAPTATIQLVNTAGSTVLCSDTDVLATAGAFVTQTCSFAALANTSFEIRLLGDATFTNANYRQVLFDNVQLTRVDNIGPTVTIVTPANGSIYSQDADAIVDFSCSDPSGIASCVGTLPDGAELGTFPAGIHTFTVTATDLLGNVTVVTHTYTVVRGPVPPPPPPPPPPVPQLCYKIGATVDLTLGQTPTPGADRIAGTPGNDVINGLGGNDIICGRGGNDRINGAAGNDIIFGSGGNDSLFGGTGNDILRGRTGVDDCHGGPGSDVASGCETTTGVP